MFRLLAIICCIYTAGGASVPSSLNGRIIDGETITIQAAPHQISILKTETNRHTCGGSIVSSHFVLTAAHCTGLPASGYKIRSGSSFWNRDGRIHQVIEVIPHEKYHQNEFGIVVNDVALMKVKEPFDVDKTRKIITLFNHHENAEVGADAVVTGWGLTENGTLANQLQSLTIAIVDHEKCNKAYEGFGGVPKGQICAAYSTGLKDMCSGDSGGPLLVGGRQVGIVSWSGPGCAIPEHPGVYTEVASYRDWIDKHIKV